MTEIQEGVELPEFHESHQEYRYTLPVSLTISILAVLVAGATLLGHRAHTEELLLQSRATDQWSYYQAKNIRFHEVQGIADLLGALAPGDKEKTAAVVGKNFEGKGREQGEKEDNTAKAKGIVQKRGLSA